MILIKNQWYIAIFTKLLKDFLAQKSVHLNQ